MSRSPCKLSVITPVFNGIRFIEFCIRNVIDQNCPEAEHVIVDGGSSDGTAELIRRYAAEYPHIRFVSEPDRGQSDAMNKGIAMAAGAVISFLNADDYYEPGALADAVARFDALPEPTLLVGNCNVWDDDEKLLFVSRPSGIGFLNLLLGKFMKAFPMNPSAYFYHKSLHDRIGPYEVDEHFGMDVHFIFKASREAHLSYVDRMYGNWRYLTGTKTHTDVENGQNSVRVNAITEHYLRRAPLPHRVYVPVYCRLRRVYDYLRSRLGL